MRPAPARPTMSEVSSGVVKMAIKVDAVVCSKEKG
jgi:hypothetical protein